MDTTQAPGVRHLLHRAWLGFPPGAGYAEGDVLVTLLSGTTVCAAQSISKGKGQKSGVWVLCVQAFRHKLRKGVIPVTLNSTYLKLLETFALTPSFSQSALYDNHRYLLCNTSRAPQALFSHLYYICNFPFFCQLLICQMQVMLQFHIILIP